MKTQFPIREETMAQKVMLIDDLDGSDGAETIRYTIDGQEYEIDLSEENAKRFRDALREFIEKSRQVEQPPVLTLAPARGSRRQAQVVVGGTTSPRSAPGPSRRVWT
jgi:hypothetical protein